MKVYHETTLNTVGSMLANGIKKSETGSKSDEKAIIKTDALLDEYRPHHLKEAGVSRQDNIYCYLRTGDSIVEIINGDHVALRDFVTHSDQAVLEIEVDPNRCYVSDLDTYDALKNTINSGKDKKRINELATSYWHKVVKLSDFKANQLRRPEIMVTYDIEPSSLRQLH